MSDLVIVPVDHTPTIAARRAQVLVQHTAAAASAAGAALVNAAPTPSASLSPTRTDSIDAALTPPVPRPELIPLAFATGWFAHSRVARSARRWMGRKFALGQDLFLIGAPGPMRRWIALSFAAGVGREVEYLCLSRDSSER